MKRYFSIERDPGEIDILNSYRGPHQETISVWEQDSLPQRTGLLDSRGTPIYYNHIKEKVGFKLTK